jgi:hypothetical protein
LEVKNRKLLRLFYSYEIVSYERVAQCGFRILIDNANNQLVVHSLIVRRGKKRNLTR